MTERAVWNWLTAVVMALSMVWLIASQGTEAAVVKPTLVTVPAATTSTSSTSTSTSTTSTSTTSTTVAFGFEPRCPVALLQAALDVGWSRDELQTLDRIAYAESRCSATAHNGADPGSIGSVSVMQVNSGAWCDGTQYYPEGYLQHIGLISSCADLWDVSTNLAAALVIWQRSGWQAWATYD